MNKGLSNEEAEKKLHEVGFNELPSAKAKNVFHIAFEVMKEPMFLLLICSGVLYITLGDTTEGVILLCSIFIIIFITFYQYQKTEKALNSLKKLSSPQATVIRDGAEMKIPGRELVPDDVLILHEGDRVPADAIILEQINMSVDESMLTGESIPVSKQVAATEIAHEGLLFSGTMIIQGKGKAKVLKTGIETQLGKIGASLESIVQDQTRLQKEMKILIRNLFIIGALLSVAIVVAFYVTRGHFVQSLLNGLAAAMAILPEEFPVVLTVFLALGAWRLSKKNVLTRNPSVIETLGSATVLCSDKTGTITQNKMEVSALYDGEHTYLKDVFYERKKELATILLTAELASQKDTVDPMEKAIVQLSQTMAWEKASDYKLIKEYPLSKELFAMTRVVESQVDHRLHVMVKGAPEAIFALCGLSDEEIKKHVAFVDDVASRGFRVLGVANGIASSAQLPELQSDFDVQFLGLIALEDPIRPEVPQAVKECQEAGIRMIMITGDYPATAKSIASQIGLASEHIITGDELKEMKDDELLKRISTTTIFARVIPEQKLRIVNALKADNQIVGMTGDGVNDAPALKAAHIGIAMGMKGTDVARDASSLVLLDDNFTSIIAAIRSGRRIFDNLQKAMSYIIAIHIPIIGLTLFPAFDTNIIVLMLPLHIVFLELIIDPVCSIAFEYEQEEMGIMNRPPRDINEKFFGGKKILVSVIQGLLLLGMVLSVYFLSVYEGHTEGQIRAITFSALIIGNIFLILTDLSKTRSFFAVILERNYPVLIILTSALVMLILLITIPYFQKVFSFEFPGYKHFIPSLVGACSILLIFEVRKYILNKKLK